MLPWKQIIKKSLIINIINLQLAWFLNLDFTAGNYTQRESVQKPVLTK
jgi:hypothetical protein